MPYALFIIHYSLFIVHYSFYRVFKIRKNVLHEIG